MPVSHSVTVAYKTNNGSVSLPLTAVTGDAELVYDDTLAAGVTNKEIVMALDVSALKGFVIVVDAITATKTVTVKTNSSSSPADTLTLTPAAPGVFWFTGSWFDNPLTTDVTSFFVTSTDTAPRRLRIYVCADVTP